METISYGAPTAVYSGVDCLNNNKRIIASFGQRAFIITSRFSQNCRNFALEDILRIFSENGTEYAVYDEAEENPSVSSIVRVTERIRAFAPEYIFAIGGGSALDTAKAANVLINYPPQADAYKVFYSGTPCINNCNSGALPMLAVPTTAGSGSEVMGFSILTRSDTDTKLRINQLSFFSAAFLDARYVASSPLWLLDAGVMDALSHGIEGVLNTRSSSLSRIWNFHGFALFAKFKDALASGIPGNEECGQMLLAAAVQGMGNMQCGSTIPHGMGYALTHFKNVPHGIANMMVMPAFLRTIHDKDAVNDIVHACGFESLDDFEEYVLKIVRRNVRIEVTEEELDAWAKECASLKPRLEAHIEPISAAQIRAIFSAAIDACNR